MARPTMSHKPKMVDDFKLHPEGTHIMRVQRIVDFGEHVNDYGTANILLHFTFESCFETINVVNKQTKEKQDMPMLVSPWAYKYSMTPRADLRKHSEAILGKKFASDEEAQEFNVFDLVGKPCQVTIVHNEANNGKIYANVENVTGLAAGMEPPPKLVNKPVIYTATYPNMFGTLPEWMQDKINAAVNKADPTFDDPFDDDEDFDQSPPTDATLNKASTQGASSAAPDFDSFDDDIPF